MQIACLMTNLYGRGRSLSVDSAVHLVFLLIAVTEIQVVIIFWIWLEAFVEDRRAERYSNKKK